jgi:hypothetical protein
MKITNLPKSPLAGRKPARCQDGKSKRTSIAALMASVGQPYVDAAHLSADRAAAAAPYA